MLTVIILLFVLGYLAIALEHKIHVNKAASAILTGVLCWTLYAIYYATLVPTKAFEEWHAKHGGAEAEGGLDPKLHFLVDGGWIRNFTSSSTVSLAIFFPRLPGFYFSLSGP